MGTGPKESKLVLIGESPGEEEDRNGLPFIGKAGKLLNSICINSGIDRDTAYVTNVIKCHPYYNNKPSVDCVSICSEKYLAQELREIRPQLIICMGGMSSRALLQEQMQIAHARNNIWYTKEPMPAGIPFIVTYHPAATFHMPDLLSNIIDDFNWAKKLLEGSLPQKKRKIRYQKVENLFDIPEIKKAKWLDIDTETDGLDPFLSKKKILSLQISVKEGEGYYLDWNEKVEKDFRRFTDYTSASFNGHNIKHDLKWLRVKGNIHVDGEINDTIQDIHLIDENFPNKSLGVVTTSYTELKAHKDEFVKLVNQYVKMNKRKKEPIGKARGRLWAKAFKAIPLRIRIKYGCGDADATRRLRRTFRPKLKEKGLIPLHNLMMDTTKMFIDIECNGIKIDPFLHEELTIIYDNRINDFIDRLDGWAIINHRSNQQLQHLLYGKWKLKGHTVKSGKKWIKYSTGKEAIDLLLIDDIGEFKKSYLRELLKYRKMNKLYGTYIKGFHRMNRNGFIHANWNLTGTVTGRNSCKNPNLMQLPRKSDIKKLFVSRFDDGCLGQVDASQGELRVMAHRANIKKMIHAFNTGLDIHSATAADGLGIPIKKVTEEERYRYKQANFSIGFGSGVAVAANEMETDIETARRVMDNWNRSYPEWKEHVSRMEDFVIENHYIRNLFGRYRHLFILDPNTEEGKRAIRQAVNSDIQGSLADYNKLCGVAVWKRIRKEELDNEILIIGEVHDSYWFDLRKKHRGILFEIIKDAYENPDTSEFGFQFKVPMKVDVKYGPNLQEMKEWHSNQI
jgi:DNA polymerase-1